METMTLKNKRLKMSPGGLITLNVAARKALGMKVHEPAHVSVTVSENCIVLTSKASKEKKMWRVSKSGQLELGGDAKEFLLKSTDRHYWLQLDDKKNEVRLMPF